MTRGIQKLSSALVLSMLAAAPVGARQQNAEQARPDFSGRWTNAAPPAAQAPAPGGRGGGPAVPSGDMGSGWGSTITLTQTLRVLTVEYAFFTRGDMQPPLKFTFALDGSESKNTVMMGRGFQVERSNTTWDGQTLVITTQHDFRDPSGKPVTAEVTRRLSLESADSLIVETTRAGVLGGPPSTTRVVYRRLPPAGG